MVFPNSCQLHGPLWFLGLDYPGLVTTGVGDITHEGFFLSFLAEQTHLEKTQGW